MRIIKFKPADSFEFINGEKSAEYYWSELKNEFIYDRIKDIL